jgi:calcium-dependent protein kinase
LGIEVSTFVKLHQGGLSGNFKIGKRIGEGAIGEVRLGKEKDSKTTRALKFINKGKFKKSESKAVMTEVTILSQLDHPNIVKLYEFYEEPKNYCLVMELCTGGELFDGIVANKNFSEVTARTCVKQILSCVNYIHGKGFVHRDLKPENILLEPDLDFNKMKFIDFGTAEFYDKKGLNVL